LDPADPVSLYSVACDGHDRKLAHLRHTAWTFKDGAPAEVYSLAQTPDGFLWLGTASGFFHLAGIRFSNISLHQIRNSTSAGSDLFLEHQTAAGHG
jgi:hypothetical protein